ncbi:CMRF35-like molecule 8 [Denticeps clupeoides]|uniref:CMRF35-like molecule 8 n=1 Tax=Denticeps clupeoides TaxID=299321 RepID=UPI0010A575FA|nr:CMRF35-like molecule 8 [Denticeps clupeoides]
MNNLQVKNRMKTFFIFVLYFISGYCDEPIVVRGRPGEAVEFHCKYLKKLSDKRKCFCKMDTVGTCDIMDSSSFNNTNKQKFTLHDNKVEREITVTMKDLTGSDAGVYWCGAEQGYLRILHIMTVHITVSPLIGYEGGQVIFTCPYDKTYSSNAKFLCRGICPLLNRDVLIKTQPGKSFIYDGRFSLKDYPAIGLFTVTIRRLAAEDSGKYMCVVERSLPNIYTELQLIVVEAPKMTTISQTVNIRGTSSTSSTTTRSNNENTNLLQTPFDTTVILSVSLTVTVLVFGIISVMFYSLKRRKSQESASSSDKNDKTESKCEFLYLEREYEEVKAPRNRHSENRGSSVYANTEHLTMKPSDGLTYSTIIFKKNSMCPETATFSKEDTSCDYSTLNYLAY